MFSMLNCSFCLYLQYLNLRTLFYLSCRVLAIVIVIGIPQLFPYQLFPYQLFQPKLFKPKPNIPSHNYHSNPSCSCPNCFRTSCSFPNQTAIPAPVVTVPVIHSSSIINIYAYALRVASPSGIVFLVVV
jgi:hypothetical protein